MVHVEQVFNDCCTSLFTLGVALFALCGFLQRLCTWTSYMLYYEAGVTISIYSMSKLHTRNLGLKGFLAAY